MFTPPNPNITYVGVPPPTGDNYQAESATLGSTFIETTNAGFMGWSYVNFCVGSLTFVV